MFKLVDKKGNKYLVLDTDDGVMDECFWEDLINFLQSGVVQGLTLLSGKIFYKSWFISKFIINRRQRKMLDFSKDCRSQIYEMSNEELFQENILLLVALTNKADAQVVHNNLLTFTEELKRRRKNA